MSIFELIKKYPKKRGILPEPLKKMFDSFYLSNRENLFLQLVRRWLHSIMNDKEKEFVTLEIGAGTLNHLKYEKTDIYDIIEPKKFLYSNSDNIKLINKTFDNIDHCKNRYYDRIISIAVLEHLIDLPRYLYESSKKMKENSYQQHSIPCEGYPMWNITWFLISGISFRLKFGYSFKYIQKHEHVNNFDEILALIKFFYKDVKVKFSYPLYNKYLSLYSNIKFSNPNKENIQKYLQLNKTLIN